MDDQQKSTQQVQPISVSTINVERDFYLTPAHEDYIAFVALGGLIPDPDGEKTAIKMTATQLANRLGVDRTTLYTWRRIIPNFWERVAQKRREIGGKDRVSQVWNGLFLKAASGDSRAAAIYLANHDDNFRMPTEKREIDIGDGLAEAMMMARKRNAQQQSQQPIEGEVINAPESPAAQ